MSHGFVPHAPTAVVGVPLWPVAVAAVAVGAAVVALPEDRLEEYVPAEDGTPQASWLATLVRFVAAVSLFLALALLTWMGLA
ncbi:hypothetical protein BRD17_05250 [Halobacteriales archaeon SW_7_68_16]|nr:MAG: hypothetical protein BRD17_05250 [Halobacteriales archaeon SW_7_68_16]